MLFRADKIDLKSLDDELEKHLTRILSRHIDAKRPKEEWEIDLAKLNLQHVVANGIYMALSIRALMMAKMLQVLICTLSCLLLSKEFKICYLSNNYSMFLDTKSFGIRSRFN
ncbi:hypothetical protein S83_063929 [Arachis hypogaea]|nr:serine/threonine-protein kinase HT1-like [Arachis hypogaea]